MFAFVTVNNKGHCGGGSLSVTDSNLQGIVLTVNGKGLKIMAIRLKMNVREQCSSERRGTKMTSQCA